MSTMERCFITERPEYAGTHAEKLAMHRACAAHALWAVRYGGFSSRAWLECPRPDWLADCIALGADYSLGSPSHRRLVAALCQGAAIALERSGITDPRPGTAIRVALEWAEGHADLEQVVKANTQIAGLTGEGMGKVAVLSRGEQLSENQEAAMLLEFGATSGAHFASLTVMSGAAAMTAALAISLALTGSSECHELATIIRRWFPQPPEEVR
ncbi:MAG: hypothetical protein HC882_07010 [Acidobacteria bacterium]|nr:hypothetical protein [Acidobacteriota bacterium]